MMSSLLRNHDQSDNDTFLFNDTTKALLKLKLGEPMVLGVKKGKSISQIGRPQTLYKRSLQESDSSKFKNELVIDRTTPPGHFSDIGKLVNAVKAFLWDHHDFEIQVSVERDTSGKICYRAHIEPLSSHLISSVKTDIQKVQYGSHPQGRVGSALPSIDRFTEMIGNLRKTDKDLREGDTLVLFPSDYMDERQLKAYKKLNETEKNEWYEHMMGPLRGGAQHIHSDIRIELGSTGAPPEMNISLIEIDMLII